MSYDIVYNRQFIRVGNYVLPMILLGDSRTYDVYRGSRGQTVQRRDRHWCPMVKLNGKILVPDSELIHEVDGWCNSYDTHFYYQGKFLSNKQLQNFVRLGCRRAMTFREMGIMDAFHLQPSLTIYVFDYDEKNYYTHPVKILRLTDENIEKEIRDLEMLLQEHPHYGCRFDFGGEKPVHRKYVPIQHQSYWAVFIPSRMAYLHKIYQHRVYFTQNPAGAKLFATEKGIDNFLKKNKWKITFAGQEPEKRKVNFDATFHPENHN